MDNAARFRLGRWGRDSRREKWTGDLFNEGRYVGIRFPISLT